MKETKKHIDFRAMSREEIETYAVSMTDKVEQLSMQLSWYEEQLRLSRKKRFGASSEKTDAAQINMFNEAESEAQEDRKEPSMGEVKPPASRKKKGHKDQLLKPLSTSRLKPFEYFQHLLEELPQIDRTDKEKLKRYLPYSDALPAYCKASDQERNN
mgnify:CR=1 FL=1